MAVPVSQYVQQILDEGPLGMAAAAALLGSFRGGRPCHPSTVVRWCLHGIKLSDGRFLKLEYIRMTDRLVTSKPALLRFLAAQQDNAVSETAAQPRTPAQRKRAADAAAEELAELGV